MHLGAMVDLGVPEAHITEQLQRLPMANEFELSFSRGEKMGIAGTRAVVRDVAAHGHHHRHYADIQKLIVAAGYTTGIEQRAIAIFDQIAEAEAKIHDVPVAEVHFHEVGAVDSIVDIVAAAVCLEYLNVERIFCQTVEVGSGFVDCEHGRLPVPAPATQEILTGVPCSYGGVEGESTTPTGAAILKASVDDFSPPRGLTIGRIGYGLGHKDFAVPNVLRVVMGEMAVLAATATHYKIEANIDDMSPEAYEPLIAHLTELGASDVYFTPIVMKKSRPATSLAVLCAEVHVDALADAVLNRSTTIGLRILPFQKRVLPRELVTVATSLGPVSVKVVTQPDGRTRWKSEFEDVKRIANEQNTDYLQIKAMLDREIARHFQDDS